MLFELGKTCILLCMYVCMYVRQSLPRRICINKAIVHLGVKYWLGIDGKWEFSLRLSRNLSWYITAFHNIVRSLSGEYGISLGHSSWQPGKNITIMDTLCIAHSYKHYIPPIPQVGCMHVKHACTSIAIHQQCTTHKDCGVITTGRLHNDRHQMEKQALYTVQDRFSSTHYSSPG